MPSKRISKSKKVGFGSRSIRLVDIFVLAIIIIVVATILLGYLNK